MNDQQNRKVVRCFIEEMWNQRRLDLAHELFAPDCITHQLRGSDSPAPRSPQSVITEAEAWLSAFPDLKFDIEQMIVQDDYVVSRFTLRGTHSGPWMGIPPSGKSVAVPMMTVHRLENAKIVEDWVLVGTLTLFQQLGVLPETARIIADALKR